MFTFILKNVVCLEENKRPLQSINGSVSSPGDMVYHMVCWGPVVYGMVSGPLPTVWIWCPYTSIVLLYVPIYFIWVGKKLCFAFADAEQRCFSFKVFGLRTRLV